MLIHFGGSETGDHANEIVMWLSPWSDDYLSSSTSSNPFNTLMEGTAIGATLNW